MLKILKQFTKYGVVALGAAATDWVVFLFIFYFGSHYLSAQIVSRLAGGLFAFVANKYWSFSRLNGRLTVEARRFLLLYVVSYCLSIILLHMLAGVLGVNEILAKVLGDSILMIFNYSIMRVYVYRSRDGFGAYALKLLRTKSEN